MRSFDTRKVCIPPPRCTTVINVTACDQGCEAAATATSCGNNTTCPAKATCDVPNNQCNCIGELVALSCPGGNVCNGTCPGGKFFCGTNPRNFGCTTDQRTFRGTCQCLGGRTVDFGCDASVTTTCEDACN